jgi:4'-phosphopantetheinyl transferase
LKQAEPGAHGWLCAEETARLSAMGSPKRRAQFIAGHWLVRTVAAGFTDTDPSEWALAAAPGGAPTLLRRGADEDSGLHVSLSHSGGVVAAAVASLPLGIDIESTGRARDWVALADLVFAPSERECLRRLPEGERQAMFLRHWTLREAIGKRDGVGLRPASDETSRVHECDASQANAITWQSDVYCLALAGASDMRTATQGIADGARQLFWRFGR